MSVDVYLAEKPKQGRALAAVLGCDRTGKGCMHNGKGTFVAWCIGHLLQALKPDDYSEDWKGWKLDHLPMVPGEWKHQPNDKTRDQLKVVSELLRKAGKVYISTDFDREGEAIARNVIRYAGYQGPLYRVCIKALNPKGLRKALDAIVPGKDTINLYHSAVCRERSDWLVGMNGTRLFTLIARGAGFQETLHVGRVVCPMINLVVTRNQAIANFVPRDYWDLWADVAVQRGQFRAKWVPPEECTDEAGRCINKTLAEQVSAQLTGTGGVIEKAETTPSRESAPLPFHLNSLQQYGNVRFGYTADEVLAAAQSLYENHQAISYPRTECRYLPENMHAEAPEVMQALILSDASISGLVAGADLKRKGRCFNDRQLEGKSHEAIIPTAERINLSSLTEIERNLYDAIRRFYIAQFYEHHEFNRTVIHVRAGKHEFIAKGRQPTKQGWKILFPDTETFSEADSNEEDDADEQSTALPPINQGEPAIISGPEVTGKHTRHPPYFTEATLLSAMEHISRYVTEEQFRRILKETSGLGTPATRASIIKTAVDRGYLIRKKRQLHASDKAVALMKALPPALKSPGLTAAWEQELERVARGEVSQDEFMRKITDWVSRIVHGFKASLAATEGQGSTQAAALKQTFSEARGTLHKCFACGAELRRVKGQKGFFWGCTNRDTCNKTFPDQKGLPQKPISDEDRPLCGDCGRPMNLRMGRKGDAKRASRFWGCSGYPECRAITPYTKPKKDPLEA